MIGTPIQIAWAMQIKSQVEAEFDRVRGVLNRAAAGRSPDDVTDIQAIIRILEDKRAEVMENAEAAYFIRDWREPKDLVSRLVIGDPRYEEIKARQMKLHPTNLWGYSSQTDSQRSQLLRSKEELP